MTLFDREMNSPDRQPIVFMENQDNITFVFPWSLLRAHVKKLLPDPPPSYLIFGFLLTGVRCLSRLSTSNIQPADSS